MWHVYIHVYHKNFKFIHRNRNRLLFGSFAVIFWFGAIGHFCSGESGESVVSLVTVTVYVCVVNAAPHGWDAPNPTDVSGVEVAVSVAGRW